MSTSLLQLQIPIQALVFDCDGTLTSIEGIDELAKNNGHYEEVQSLTAMAMGQSGMNATLYQERLNLVKPTQKEVIALAEDYLTHQISDASSIIQIFKRLGKSIYIVSAGLQPAVSLFGQSLAVPKENIFAVDIQFDSQGNFLDFDKTSPLVYSDGKQKIVQQLKKIHPEMIFVGDGLNDYAVHDLVTRFIGFGGAFYRENIAEKCEYYLRNLSLAPLLPLALTPQEMLQLTTPEKIIYEQGLASLLHF